MMPNSASSMGKKALKGTTGSWYFDYCRLKKYKYWDGTPAKHDYLMVMADGPTVIGTKFTNSISSEEVTDWFSALVKKHGMPQHFVTDNGVALHSPHLNEAMATLGVTVEFVPPHRHQFKATVERAIRKLVAENFGPHDNGAYA